MFTLDDITHISKEEFSSMTKEDKELILTILREYQETGTSKTLYDIWHEDYEEIPVPIDEFICNPNYLGKSTGNGELIYPYWRKTYRKIFDPALAYEEVIFTGAIGVGKTKTADVCLAYKLYELMCLKNPQKYFNMIEGEEIAIFFLNITLTLAEGVGYKTLHKMLLASPWFLERGATSGRINILYSPPKNITIKYGSKSEHALGQQCYCLATGTKVLTTEGIFNIEDLENKKFKTYCMSETGETVISEETTVMQTAETNDYYEIELEDGSIIKCTPEHRFMLTDGTYKMAKDLTEEDELMEDTSHRYVYIINVRHLVSDSSEKFYDVIDSLPYHNFAICTKYSKIFVHNCAMMDECDFTRGGIKGSSALDVKNGIMVTYNAIKERMNSRFIKNGRQYARLFMVSSKKSDQDFIEAYIKKMQTEKQDQHLLVIDEPQWVIKPNNTFSGKKFPVAVGNKSLKSMILNDDLTEEQEDAYKKQGYRILMVPVELKQSFVLDVNTALMNLAGISVIGATTFFNYDMFSKCYIKDYKNPFVNDILTIGTKDDLQIADFFQIDKIPMAVRSMPQFIHIDASLTGDKTGISDVGSSGVKETQIYDGANETIISEMTYKHIFSVDIKAPQGSEISFEKTRRFIYHLRSQGFNIVGVSLDGFQSADTKQLLIQQGYDATILSMDKSPEGYLTLRSAMNDERIGLIQIELLEKELIELQRDVQTGRLDHPAEGSKDLSDSLAGAVLNATKHKDSLVDSGQLLSTMANINAEVNPQEEFMQNFASSLAATQTTPQQRAKNSQLANDALNNLLNNFGNDNILMW